VSVSRLRFEACFRTVSNLWHKSDYYGRSVKPKPAQEKRRERVLRASTSPVFDEAVAALERPADEQRTERPRSPEDTFDGDYGRLLDLRTHNRATAWWWRPHRDSYRRDTGLLLPFRGVAA
jgi:hypothetical protein